MSEAIIVPCTGDQILNSSPAPMDVLRKGEFLGEFETLEDKAKARINLGVKSEVEIDEKFTELETLTSQLSDTITKHILDLEDPHKTLQKIQAELANFVKMDGSRPFRKPQMGVTPITESHLTTKDYVDKAIIRYFTEENIKADDALFEKIKNHLASYALKSETYSRRQTYSREEINDAFNEVVRKDGSIPFENPVSGRDPRADSHLTTKRYVDNKIQDHLLKEDPHGIKGWMLDVLKGYASKHDMAKVNEADVKRYAEERVRELLSNLSEQSNPLDLRNKLQNWGYVKKDGTTPFEAPQKGVIAVEDAHLITLGQVRDMIVEKTAGIEEQFNDMDALNHWYTDGPVETTVGYVRDNTNLPEVLTLQEILDLIFYGKGVTIIVPEYAEPGTTVPVCLQIAGSPKRIQTITVYQDGKVIWSGVADDFQTDKEICFESDILTENPTNWEVHIEYLKGESTLYAQTTLIGGSFFGALDMFKNASTIQYNEYEEMVLADSVNVKKVLSGDITDVVLDMNFESYTNPKQLFAAVPMTSPDLKKIETRSQAFSVGPDGWNIVKAIPLDVNGVSVMYKVFVYKEPIVALTQEAVTFKF